MSITTTQLFKRDKGAHDGYLFINERFGKMIDSKEQGINNILLFVITH